MAGRKHHPGIDVTDIEFFVIGKELVPLAAVGGQIGPVVDGSPELLHLDDLFADRGGGAGPGPEILRGREMVGVGMGVENPLDRITLLAHEG